MTASRIRGSEGAVSNSYSGTECLDGLTPVVEDWHAKMCLLEVLNAFTVYLPPFITVWQVFFRFEAFVQFFING